MKTKDEKRKMFDALVTVRDRWRRKNSHYYRELERFLSFHIPVGSSVLEVGAGTGETLSSLKPYRGVGTDISPGMVEAARRRHPGLEFLVDDIEDTRLRETFDYVVMTDLLGELTDVWAAFRNVASLCREDTRVVITSFNALWEPILNLGERLGLKMPQDYQNWLSPEDVENLLVLNGFEVVKKGYRTLLPYRVPLLSSFLNRFAAKLPLLRKFCFTIYLVARPLPREPRKELAVTVVVPCRNERGNIRPAVERTPSMGTRTEIIFVDGNSNDGTVDEIEKVMEEYRGRKEIRLIHQVPRGSAEGAGHGKMLSLGKGDAVWKGFAAARGDVLMILDADLTVPPEDLPKFYQALVEGRGEFINGTRLVYPMEKDAMRSLNKLGNKFFSWLFTWLLEQRLRDTLCGTKVLLKRDYEKISREKGYFGDFDPFGDFALLFGSAKLCLRIIEVPIRYRERTYGEIKIQRFKHGLLLLRMSGIAFKKLKLN